MGSAERKNPVAYVVPVEAKPEGLHDGQATKPRPSRFGALWWLAPFAVAGGVAYLATLPPQVKLVHPTVITITESIAATGSVKGRKESVVGAQMAGTVQSLYVREGDRVKKGQLIATIRNAAAEGAVAQATQAVATARAQLAQAALKPLPSDLDAARSRIAQASESQNELSSRLTRAQVAIQQAASAVSQAGSQMAAAEAAQRNAQAQLDLAKKSFERTSELFQAGALAKKDQDQSETTLKAAQATAEAANANVASANAALDVAKHSERAARLDVSAAQSQIAQAKAATDVTRAQYRSLLKQPLGETVALYRARVADAEAALKTAQAQAQYAQVVVPFDGVVTQLLSEVGSSATVSGVVKVAEMGVPQITVALDENDMGNLRIGQKTLVSSAANPDDQLSGKVIRIGPEVDFSRGTVEVLVEPDKPASWLLPGQTVNVNLIKGEGVRRVAIPVSAVRQEGSGEAALMVQNGRTVVRKIRTGPAVDSLVPVLSGLTTEDLVVENAEKLTSDTRVRVAK